MPDDAPVSPPKIGDVSAALALHEPRRLVDSYAAYLRREGLLPSTAGGRGNAKGAPATPKEAAVLLVALLASDEAMNAPAAVRRFGALEFSGCEMRGTDGYLQLVAPEVFAEWHVLHRPFVEVIEALIVGYQSGTIPHMDGPILRIGVSRSGTRPGGSVELRIQKDDGSYAVLTAVYRSSAGWPLSIEKVASVASAVLLAICWALRPAEEGGFRARNEEADMQSLIALQEDCAAEGSS